MDGMINFSIHNFWMLDGKEIVLDTLPQDDESVNHKEMVAEFRISL